MKHGDTSPNEKHLHVYCFQQRKICFIYRDLEEKMLPDILFCNVYERLDDALLVSVLEVLETTEQRGNNYIALHYQIRFISGIRFARSSSEK